VWRVDESDLSGADQWNNVGQRTQKDREATTEFDMFDTLIVVLA
jgi:hypothetical protein